MKEFNEFWEKFEAEKNGWAHERENCENVWGGLPDEWRTTLLDQLRMGKRWRKRENDNPYWYLANYNGEVLQEDLPYYRQGNKKFDNWLRSALGDGIKVIIMRYEGKLAYCYKSDRIKMERAGAEYIREF